MRRVEMTDEEYVAFCQVVEEEMQRVRKLSWRNPEYPQRTARLDMLWRVVGRAGRR